MRRLALLCLLLACDTPLDLNLFQRRAEKAFVDANPGFGVFRRKGSETTFVRGDQLYTLDVAARFTAYQAKKESTNAFFNAWQAELAKEAEARRRPLASNRSAVIPVLKSGAWMRAQDLGAIGPPSTQDQIRPWRKLITPELFVVLGMREELLGVRYVSIKEQSEAGLSEDEALTLATQNLVREVGTSTGAELRDAAGKLLVYDLVNKDGVSGLLLDLGFRDAVLKKFGQEKIGAAIPNRDVLILFDLEDIVATRPVRARTHQLFDARNHPGFRGLLEISRAGIVVLEGEKGPEAAKKKVE